MGTHVRAAGTPSIHAGPLYSGKSTTTALGMPSPEPGASPGPKSAATTLPTAPLLRPKGTSRPPPWLRVSTTRAPWAISATSGSCATSLSAPFGRRPNVVERKRATGLPCAISASRLRAFAFARVS